VLRNQLKITVHNGGTAIAVASSEVELSQALPQLRQNNGTAQRSFLRRDALETGDFMLDQSDSAVSGNGIEMRGAEVADQMLGEV